MEEESNYKTRIIIRKGILKDGTFKEYKSEARYKVKGHVNADGTVSKFSEEQKEEMRRLRKLGVPIPRLMKDFNAARETVLKVVGDIEK